MERLNRPDLDVAISVPSLSGGAWEFTLRAAVESYVRQLELERMAKQEGPMESARDKAIDKLGLLLASSGREQGCSQADVAEVVDALIAAARAAESEHSRAVEKEKR